MKYKDSGVDIDSANAAVKSIKSIVKETYSKAVLSDIGAFGSMFDGSFKQYKKPVLVSSADGVGTKMVIAEETNFFEHTGEDIVNHSVNDILAVGAKPLYFLDYIGMGKMNKSIIERIIISMSYACKKNKLSLIGGELAEMSVVYNYKHFDVAGFIVGLAEKDEIITGANIKKGDILIGLHSSGFHTNGFTLVRSILKKKKIDLFKSFKYSKEPIYAQLLAPHRSYLDPVFPLVRKKKIHGIAHITGGGFYDNISRVLPKNIDALIDTRKWRVPKLFEEICNLGNVGFEDAYRTFNMGIGMVLIVGEKDIPYIEKSLKSSKIGYDIIGIALKGKGNVFLQRKEAL